MIWGLGVWDTALSLFQHEKFAFLDFGVRRTAKISKNFLGFPAQILKKVGILHDVEKVFCPRREAALAGRCGGIASF